MHSEIFVESLKTRPRAAHVLLADDYKSYDPTTTASNVAEKLADCFVDIIRRYRKVSLKDNVSDDRHMN